MNKQLSERGMSLVELAVVFGVLALIVWGMSLQAHNGNDVFTSMWAMLASMGS